MAKGKKGKKGKKGEKGAKEKENEIGKEYNTITPEEVRARASKYLNRISDMKACTNFVSDAISAVENLQAEHLIQEKWEAFIRCDGLPTPYKPFEIRTFFVEMRFYEEENSQTTIEWLLAIDERSVLSQDIFRKDLSRGTVLNEKRPNFGIEYEICIDKSLKVLKNIEHYLDNKFMVAKCPKRILEDITEQKLAVQQEILELFDRYSYRILSSEDAYMESVNANVSEYCYKGKQFQMHLWTLKNVPILFDFFDPPSLDAFLHELKICVHIPFNVLEDNLTIRAIHMEFDHFSEYAKSFGSTTTQPENLHADMQECLAYEWDMQVKIQESLRKLMTQKRADYEARMIALEEEMAIKEKKEKEKGNLKKAKTVKVPAKNKPEPTVVTPDTYFDIWEDFLDEEQRLFENFVNLEHHPNVLNLMEDEINLKKYFILGGIYQLYFVRKPTHFELNTFNMTWHVDNRNLHIKKNVVAKAPEAKPRAKSRMSSLSRTQSVLSLHKSFISLAQPQPDADDSEIFVLTFVLPKALCLWGEPVVCHFEADLVGFVKKTIVEDLLQQSPSITNLTAGAAAQTTDVDESSEHTDVNDLNQRVLTFQTRLSDNVFRPSIEQIVPPGHADNNLENFRLNLPLSKTQIRNLQRHCIPRIISSFKFPTELNLEKSESSRKPKGMGGTLIRKRLSTESNLSSKMSDRVFTYDQQYNPERIFPVFPDTEHLIMNVKYDTYTDMVRAAEPETFFDLIDALDVIKGSYKSRYERSSKLVHYRPITTTCKRILRKRQSQIEERAMKSIASLRKSLKKTHKSFITPATEELEKNDDEKPEIQFGEPTIVEIEPEPEPEPEGEMYKFCHWTTKYISRSDFDKETSTITVYTDRLGTFGFAFKQYQHFPFRFWSVEPSEENPETEIVFTLVTQHVRCVIFITGEGYRGYAADPTKEFVRNRAVYVKIDKPISDIKELKKIFREKNVNIFSDDDARFYIENASGR